MTARQQKIPPIFGRRVQREREQRGWSMRGLAAKSGVAVSTVLRTEQGHDAALSTAISLAATLGVSLDALLADSECGTCDGKPPDAFICTACGRKGVA